MHVCESVTKKNCMVSYHNHLGVPFCDTQTVTNNYLLLYPSDTNKIFKFHKITLRIFCSSQQLVGLFFTTLSWCLVVAVLCTPCCSNTPVEEFDPKWSTRYSLCQRDAHRFVGVLPSDQRYSKQMITRRVMDLEGGDGST